MGHYASEMEDRQADPYDYQAVWDAGFAPARTSMHSTDIRRCPTCFALVEGEYAMAHLRATHS